MTKRGVLFDLDGVLIDSERIYSGFYDELGELYNIEEDNFSMAIKGSTIEQILSRYFPSPEASADVLRRINEFESGMEYPVCEGVPEFLAELKSRGIPMAIVTSSSDNKMVKLWQQHGELKDFFDTIVTGSDISRSKPDPEVICLRQAVLAVILRIAMCLKTRFPVLQPVWRQELWWWVLPRLFRQSVCKEKPTYSLTGLRAFRLMTCWR